jgi:hypothetical protein
MGKKGDPEYEGVVLHKKSSGLLVGERNIVLQQ